MTVDNIKNTLNSILIKNGESPVCDFIFGEFLDLPNIRGVFCVKNTWFIYETDERNIKSISGPFNDGDITYVCAKMLHVSKYFEEYRFSKEAKSTYTHSHFRSVKEAEEAI